MKRQEKAEIHIGRNDNYHASSQKLRQEICYYSYTQTAKLEIMIDNSIRETFTFLIRMNMKLSTKEIFFLVNQIRTLIRYNFEVTFNIYGLKLPESKYFTHTHTTRHCAT